MGEVHHVQQELREKDTVLLETQERFQQQAEQSLSLNAETERQMSLLEELCFEIAERQASQLELERECAALQGYGAEARELRTVNAELNAVNAQLRDELESVMMGAMLNTVDEADMEKYDNALLISKRLHEENARMRREMVEAVEVEEMRVVCEQLEAHALEVSENRNALLKVLTQHTLTVIDCNSRIKQLVKPSPW